ARSQWGEGSFLHGTGGMRIICCLLSTGEKQEHPFMPHRENSQSVQQKLGKRDGGTIPGVVPSNRSQGHLTSCSHPTQKLLPQILQIRVFDSALRLPTRLSITLAWPFSTAWIVRACVARDGLRVWYGQVLDVDWRKSRRE
ncbi:unnamed protein product, partial [Ectocarpus sp. 8 AP-2014]